MIYPNKKNLFAKSGTDFSALMKGNGDGSKGVPFAAIAGLGATAIDTLDQPDEANFKAPSVGGSVAKGALSGAAAGASFGPWGAVIGGAVGGAAGYFSGAAGQRKAANAKQAYMVKQQQDINKASTAANNIFAQSINRFSSFAKKGGTIHIKKANRGKFNATKARTGKTTEELTHSSSAVTRKRAVFAQNAAKWKHQLGGNIYPKYCNGGMVNGKKICGCGCSKVNAELVAKGGTVPGDKVSTAESDSKEVKAQTNYLKGYVGSAGYLQRLKKEDEPNALANQAKRVTNLANNEVLPVGSLDKNDDSILGTYFSKDLKGRKLARERASLSPESAAIMTPGSALVKVPLMRGRLTGITAGVHEAVHKSTDSNVGLTDVAYKKLEGIGRSSGVDNYQANPTEIHARMGGLRYLMDREKIYESGSGAEFTQEHLDKLRANPSIMQEEGVQDLMDVYKGNDKALINHLNTIAANKRSTVPVVAKGGIIKKGDPIIVKDKNDPRLRAHDDSLALFNNHKELVRSLGKEGYTSFDADLNFKDAVKMVENHPVRSGFKAGANGMNSVDDFVINVINKRLPKQLYNRNIAPKGFQSFVNDIPGGPNVFVTDWAGKNDKLLATKKGSEHTDLREVADYSNVNPRQKVIYQPEQKVKFAPGVFTPELPRLESTPRRPMNVPAKLQPNPTQLVDLSFTGQPQMDMSTRKLIGSKRAYIPSKVIGYGNTSSQNRAYGHYETKKYGEGGAVILGGELHKNGGNDVVDEDGEKVAETESKELLLTKEQTVCVENYRQQYYKTKENRLLVELGRYFSQMIQNDTVDNSGTYAI